MDEKIEFAPILANSLEDRLYLTRHADIQRHHDRRFELLSERGYIFLGFFVQIGHASSAPSARKALAQPQAIDCSLAIPTMSPFLPSSNCAFTTGIIWWAFPRCDLPRASLLGDRQ